MTIQLAKPCADIGLVTCNAGDALRFYRDTLGLEELPGFPFPGLGEIKRFQLGDGVLRIVVLEKEAASFGSTDGFASQTGIRYIGLSVNNIEEIVAAVKQAGFKVPVDVRELRPGTHVAMIEDADGNTVELMQIEVA